MRWYLSCEVNNSVDHDIMGVIRVRRKLASGAIGCYAMVSLLACDSGDPGVQQPIEFNHKVHVVGEEMSCTDCHEGAEDGERALLPSSDLCVSCHEEAIGTSAAEANLVRMLSHEEPIPWLQVHRLATHVRFSHAKHVTNGGISCKVCHGNVAARVQPFTRPFVNFNAKGGMAACVNCHVRSAVSKSDERCMSCHQTNSSLTLR